MNQPTSIISDVLGNQNRTRSSYKRGSVHIRSFLWQVIGSYVARCSMASWGLPFEAIAASMLLQDRDRDRRQQNSRKDD